MSAAMSNLVLIVGQVNEVQEELARIITDFSTVDEGLSSKLKDKFGKNVDELGAKLSAYERWKQSAISRKISSEKKARELLREFPETLVRAKMLIKQVKEEITRLQANAAESAQMRVVKNRAGEVIRSAKFLFAIVDRSGYYSNQACHPNDRSESFPSMRERRYYQLEDSAFVIVTVKATDHASRSDIVYEVRVNTLGELLRKELDLFDEPLSEADCTGVIEEVDTFTDQDLELLVEFE